MLLRSLPAALLFAALLATSACTAGGPSDVPNDCGGGRCDEASPALEVCAAIRGNGQWIFAHFGSLARIVEDHGLIDAAAGGSSASLTIFLLESIQENPLVKDCGAESCQRQRAALMLRSVDAYVRYLAQTDEVTAIKALMELSAKVQADNLTALDGQLALDSLFTILESENLQNLVNPELLDLLARSPARIQLAKEILASLAEAANFSVSSPRILLRPGVLDFGAVGQLIGRLADFYAGYGADDIDKTLMSTFLASCAGEVSAGKQWPEIGPTLVGDMTCEERFIAAIDHFRPGVLAPSPGRPHRIDEPVGKYLPALVSTSVLVGDNVTAWQEARAAYESGAVDIAWSMDFAQVKFGYWGRAADLGKVERNGENFADAKTKKFMSLGETAWANALSLSPAEPGLSSALPIPGHAGALSAGGWSDLAPTLVLRNLGCETIVYVTREGDESPFCTGVAELVGMTTELDSMYSLDAPPEGSPPGAFRLSVEQSDIRWCTDWNDVTPTEYPNFSDFMRALYTSGHEADKNDGGRGCTID